MTFPFERVATTGDRALATWGQLKAARRGVPVVMGADEAVRILADAFSPARPNKTSVAAILAAADCIRHPQDLAEERIRAAMLWEPPPPPVGEWPATPSPSAGLTVAMNSDQALLHKVHIALIPTDDWTTVPAHLRWGGWNACPRAEYHVAALRSWRDRFGAELIGLSSDRMDLRVARRPHTRAQALELAREHYIYCNDIVDQGEGTVSRLAACLIADDWWNFWWD
jgi:hypothetical protein